MRIRDPQFTINLEPALRHLVKNSDISLETVAKRFDVDKIELFTWLKAFNHGSADGLTDARINAVKLELGAIVEQRLPLASAAPAPTIVPAVITSGPNSDIGRWLQERRVKVTGRVNCFQVEVTPDLARTWLDLNVGNRTPSKAKIHRFAVSMRAGRWTLNGETVKFSVSGRLLDGQSRLMAIVEAKVAIVLEVRGGLPDVAQQSMDIGQARQTAHAIEMMGGSCPFETAAALKMVWLWERDLLSGNKFGSSSVLENFEVPALVKRHEGLALSIDWALPEKDSIRKTLTMTEAIAFHYLFGRADAGKRDAFFDGLVSGAGLLKDNPIYCLRERMLEDRQSAARMDKIQRRALLIKAWALHFADQKCRVLTFVRKADGGEPFPEIAGLLRKAA